MLISYDDLFFSLLYNLYLKSGITYFSSNDFFAFLVKVKNKAINLQLDITIDSNNMDEVVKYFDRQGTDDNTLYNLKSNVDIESIIIDITKNYDDEKLLFLFDESLIPKKVSNPRSY